MDTLCDDHHTFQHAFQAPPIQIFIVIKKTLPNFLVFEMINDSKCASIITLCKHRILISSDKYCWLLAASIPFCHKIRVHTLVFNALQLILGSHAPY